MHSQHRCFYSFLFVLFSFLAAVVWSGPAVAAGPRAARTVADGPQKARLEQSYGRLPLSFEQNRGQTDKRVRFLSRGPGYSLFLTNTEAVFALQAHAKGKTEKGTAETKSGKPQRQTGTVLRMRLAGANSKAAVTGASPLPGRVNYFVGKDQSQWRSDVATFAKVQYAGVYPGVDLLYYGTQRQLEYDFIVHAGADPDRIRFTLDGAKGLRVTAGGDLNVSLPGGAVQWRKPVVYQQEKGRRVCVPGRYIVQGRTVGFRVGAYDRSRPLVIDPVLAYSTFLGGTTNGDNASAVTVDSAGNAYVTGLTFSTDFPATAGAFQTTYGGAADAFVTKLNATGTALVYSTYLGGTRDDIGWAIAVDASGAAYVTGRTYSTNFPTTSGAFQTIGNKSNDGDAFVTKLNAAGSALVYSTYLGGSDFDSGNAIAVDSAGNALVAGFTTSFNTNDFPVTAGALQTTAGGSGDAFIAKLNASGTALLYSTYLGGKSDDGGNAIALDLAGNAYVSGYTQSTNFPVIAGALQAALNGFRDAFVAKINPSGAALIYSTYMGGSQAETASALAVDTSGNVYVSGNTSSPDFATAGAFQTTLQGVFDAFVTKLNAAGTALVYSTYLGGSGEDVGNGTALDSAGNAYVTGYTTSTNFPTTADAVQVAFGGGQDAFVTKLNASGTALLYSTFLGGNKDDVAYVTALDSAGNAYVTGRTDSTNFPVTAGAFQSTLGGVQDAFVSKLNIGGGPPGPRLSTFTLSRASLTGASSAVGTVTLSAPAIVDTTITLASSKPAVATVPASVTIPAGQSSAAFALSTTAVATTTSVTLSASDASTTLSATLSVLPPTLAGLSLAPATLIGGASATATVTLNGPAPAGGAVITLARSSTLLSIPASVTVAAGQTRATFPVATTVVLNNASATVSATYKGVTKSATLAITVRPNAVKGLALLPTTVNDGSPATATVTLTTVAPAGGVIVALASTDTNLATVPASIVVPAGKQQAQFLVSTKYVIADVFVTILASANGQRAGATLTIKSQPKASILEVLPTSVTGGVSARATVRLSKAAWSGGSVVRLTSSTGAATVPLSVTVPAGQTQVSFTVLTKDVAATTKATLTASAGGQSTSAVLTIVPAPPVVTALGVYAATVAGGKSTTGDVRLSKPAPAGGTVVKLLSSKTGVATVPASVTIAAGKTQGLFAIATKAVAASTTVVISAAAGGQTKSVTLTVTK